MVLKFGQRISTRVAIIREAPKKMEIQKGRTAEDAFKSAYLGSAGRLQRPA